MEIKIKGCDLSYCQQGLNFKALAAQGARFAIIRAGHGLKIDSQFEANTRGVAGEGIDFGYYWFIESNTVAGVRAEAAKCIETLGTWYTCQRYPVYFDLEDVSLIRGLSKDQVNELFFAFANALNAAGYYVGLYTNPDWLENHYNKAEILNNYDLWLAHWTNNENKPSDKPYRHQIHQWGIFTVNNMQVDGDNCYVNYPQVIAEWRNKRNINTNTQFNKDAKVSLKGIPVYRTATDLQPYKCIAADNTEYIVATGLVSNGRVMIYERNNPNNCFFAPVEVLEPVSNTAVKVTYNDAQITAIAKDVIAGKYGSGETRKKLLTKYGYPVEKVQAKVNELLFSKK
jgi:hypothetical protein